MTDGVEIERKFLLRAMPDLPGEWKRVEIEQGYLDAAHVSAAEDAEGIEYIREGRLRRTMHDDGRVVCTHTIKRGMGLVREESERELSEAELEALWPDTEGMRLRKTRWLWRDGEAEWVVDRFHDVELVLAEVELPSEEHEISIPPLIERVMEREVTDESQYVNSEIARRIGRQSSRAADDR